MIIRIILIFVVLPLGLLTIFVIAKKMWDKADMKQKKSNIKAEQEMYDEIKDINISEVEKQKKTVEKFIKK